MLFCEPEVGSQEPRVIFIRRSARLRSHSGQIGFPGGRRDSGDINPLATALRETEEELGIPASSITPLGALDPVQSLEGSNVWPLVGYTTFAFADLRLNEDEVAEAFAIPCSDLTSTRYQSFSFTIFGYRRTSHLFVTTKISIWGLTAQMLKNARLVEL